MHEEKTITVELTNSELLDVILALYDSADYHETRRRDALARSLRDQAERLNGLRHQEVPANG